jgi:phage terminase large subunit-like protein
MEHSGIERGRIGHRHPPGRVRVGNFGNLVLPEVRADRIVAEVNNGGDMVGATLRMVDPNVAFSAVRASRGKVVRAEPVAALYQQGRVHHIGTFPQLEDQMTNFTSDIDRAAAGYSPGPR